MRRVEVQSLLNVCWNPFAEIGWMAQLGSFPQKSFKVPRQTESNFKAFITDFDPPVVEKGDVAAERRKNLALAGTKTSSPVFV
jgi:hypothetical protein